MRTVLLSIALWITLGSTHSYSNPICNLPTPENKKIKDLLASRETALKEFSNKKEIASKADQTLSSFITAKSKVIGNWLNKRNLQNASEDEVVKEWRRYYAENFILGQYPSKDPEVNLLTEKLIEGIYSKFLPPEEQKRIQSIYEIAKSGAIRKIQSFDINPEQKSQILSRVSAIKLYWMTSFKTSKFKEQALEVFSWGIAYDPIANEINMGLEVLQYASDETLFAVFAHEIGHSFDPCRWGAFFNGPYPFEKVISCLRTKDSVEAKMRNDAKMEAMVKEGKLSKDLILSLKLNPSCNKLQYPPIGVQADQTPESFSDWFSAEVVSESKYISNKLRNDLCEVKKLNSGSSYPTNKLRLEKIYLAHPKIKKQLKFDGNAKYCTL